MHFDPSLCGSELMVLEGSHHARGNGSHIATAGTGLYKHCPSHRSINAKAT